MRAFAQKVSLVIYQEYADVLEDSPAKVTVTLNDGRKIDRAKYYATGSRQVPMSAQEIKAKFDVCAAEAVDKTMAEKIYATLSSFGEQPSLKDFGRFCKKLNRSDNHWRR